MRYRVQRQVGNLTENVIIKTSCLNIACMKLGIFKKKLLLIPLYGLEVNLMLNNLVKYKRI